LPVPHFLPWIPGLAMLARNDELVVFVIPVAQRSSLDEAKRNPGRSGNRSRAPGFHSVPSGLQGFVAPLLAMT
jgi:hypothetical protein